MKQSIAELLAQKLVTEPVSGDKQQLDDSTLKRLAKGEKILSPEKQQCLLHSPLTLQRLKLFAEHEKRQTQNRRITNLEANSLGVLKMMAADSGGHRLSHQAFDFSIYEQQGQWQMLLVVKANLMLKADDKIQLLDKNEEPLLVGELDEDLELMAAWQRDEEPGQYLQRIDKRLYLDRLK